MENPVDLHVENIEKITFFADEMPLEMLGIDSVELYLTILSIGVRAEDDNDIIVATET